MVSDATFLCLAAGQGTRLRPHTDDRPKAMVTVGNRPLVDWLIDTAHHVGIDNIAVVSGYRAEMLKSHLNSDIRVFENPEFEHTDMVQSLWCAERALEGTVVISYSDVLYSPTALDRVLSSPHDVSVAVDARWQSYWESRHENPIEDAESLSIDKEGRITSIGQPIDAMTEPDAQYVGLIKLSPAGLEQFRAAYREAAASSDESLGSEGRSFDTLHMTDLLQRLVDRGTPVHAVDIGDRWVEIDTPRDLDIARAVCHPAGDGTLAIDRTEDGVET